MRRDLSIVLLLALFSAGCFGGNTSSNVEVAPVAKQEEGEEVAHPEYAHWSQFPIGAKTVRRKEVSNEQGKVVVTTTVKLLEKSDRQVVVETQISVERSGEAKLDNPPFTAEYPDMFRLPKNMSLDQFRLPSLKAKLEGTEEMEIVGEKFQVEKYVWQESNEAGPMDIVVWRCDKIPGRTVREETITKSLSSTSREDVIEFEIPSK